MPGSLSHSQDTTLVTRGPQLFLTYTVVPGLACRDRLAAALTAAPIASVRLVAPAGAALDATLVRPLVELIQSHGVAALIDGNAALARALRADGVHIPPGEDQAAALADARDILGTRYIVGAGNAGSRHEAMTAGELNVDYVAFSGEHRDDLVHWWAEIFELPCVALGTSPLDAAALAQAGVDFIGFDLPSATAPADIQALVRAITSAAADASTVKVS